MKKTITIYTLFLLGITLSNAQSTQFAQSFESATSDNWDFTLNPTTYNTEGHLIVSGSEDVWGVIEEFTGDIDAPSDGNLFFGTQDLNNTNGGGSFYHTITFEAIDVSNLTDMTLSFDYFTNGFDSSDFIKYEILLDNTSSFADNTANDGTVGGIDLNKSTLAWTTVNTVIPNGTSFVRLRIKAIQDGSADFSGIDNIKLVGINGTLSINSFNEKPALNIFPNPTVNFIKISGLTKTANYKIYNVLGAETKKGTISKNEKIDVQNLNNGIYFLKFEDGNTIKFIKE
ncbi:T9SS type A sorting domain-containing protein [Aquimarina sp. 2201CG14-23]|uniref:T9SS type A sorting domain-containing protein n=1 Tax=Aquimarina mycalae TaxID=3040073 RepID=UPI0024781497|nr:T9SS type A sorting domain-containing protein [Aquimarina sp. 2201CG14-23]MDH7447555.1 T9SS type A sorting domain-containing protein [Aquimarina sp. 2201CG14-23]